MTDELKNARAEYRARIKADSEALEGVAEVAREEHRDLAPIEAATCDRLARRIKESRGLLEGLGPEPEPARPHRDTYSETEAASYFMDLAAVRSGAIGKVDPHAARRRLEANNREVERHNRLQVEVNERRMQRRGAVALGSDGQPVSYRDLSTGSGSGGEFAPPTYLVDHFASIARSAAPLVALSDRVPLPEGCFEIVVPNFATFANTTSENQDLENVPPVARPANPTTTVGGLTAQVGTIQSMLTISQQVFDRVPSPGLDKILMQEAAEGYAEFLEEQLFVGDGIGSGGDYPGIYDNPGIFQQVYNDASPTVTKLVLNVAQAAAGVGNARKRMPTAVFAAPARLEWLFGNNVVTDDGSDMRVGTGLVTRNGDDMECYGPVAGLPCYASGALNLTGTEDVMFVGRPGELLLLESDPRFDLQAEGTVAGQLGVLFRARTYVCSVLRYPSGWASVFGTGLVRGAGW